MLDAHSDLRDSYGNNVWSHACTARRLLDEINPDQLIQIGLRGVSKEEVQFARENKITQFFSHQSSTKQNLDILEQVNSRVDSYDGVYLTIDMDVFDPSFVPGVGNPEPMGHSPMEIFPMLLKIPEIIGIDITELNPLVDPSGISQITAAKLALNLMS